MRRKDQYKLEELESRIRYLEKHSVIVSKHTSNRPGSVLLFKDDEHVLDEILTRENV